MLSNWSTCGPYKAVFGPCMVRKFPYTDPAFSPVFLITFLTSSSVLINENNVLLICLKNLFVKNKVLSCSTFCVYVAIAT